MTLDRGFSESQYLNEIEQLEKKLAEAEKRIEELEKPPTCKNCYTGKQVWREGKLIAVLCEVNNDNPERPTNRCWDYSRTKGK